MKCPDVLEHDLERLAQARLAVADAVPEQAWSEELVDAVEQLADECLLLREVEEANVAYHRSRVRHLRARVRFWTGVAVLGWSLLFGFLGVGDPAPIIVWVAPYFSVLMAAYSLFEGLRVAATYNAQAEAIARKLAQNTGLPYHPANRGRH